jgi:hypothetical protein
MPARPQMLFVMSTQGILVLTFLYDSMSMLLKKAQGQFDLERTGRQQATT